MDMDTETETEIPRTVPTVYQPYVGESTNANILPTFSGTKLLSSNMSLAVAYNPVLGLILALYHFLCSKLQFGWVFKFFLSYKCRKYIVFTGIWL